MDEYKVTVWFSEAEGGWCVQETGNAAVYVYGTKRSMMNAAETKINKHYHKEDENE